MSSLLPVIDEGLPTGVVSPFQERVGGSTGPLLRERLTQLQINVGKLCNQTCTHCHVEAGPTKTRENMDAKTADRVIELAEACETLETIDITGGAPELNPEFRRLVETFRRRGRRVIDRSNLTILLESGFEWLGPFLADQGVDVVASLPCYLESNVDGQRGRGVFDRSIRALQELNRLGYGRPGTGLRLDLVYNPTGPSLPPDQFKLEADYKRELRARFGIEFDHLLTLTNLPIKRYASFLQRQGKLEAYLHLLAENFNAAAARHVMCRSLVSVSWDGKIYDCDFNQMIELAPREDGSRSNAGGGMERTGDAPSIWSIDSLEAFVGRRIAVADHCYGCTAGAGSSCGGALVEQGERHGR